MLETDLFLSRNLKRRDLILWGGSLLTVAFSQKRLRAQDRRDIVALAEKITVRITTPGSPGSGVLVRKTGETYIVLTAAHVIKGTNTGEEAYIQTFDGEQYPLDTNSIRFGRNVDLALVVFQSERTYTLAELGDSQSIARLDEIYVAGFPLPDQGITNPSFTIDSGKVNSIGVQRDGYGITYTAVTQPGMSGGPVLDRSGKLVGIHGRAGGENVGEIRLKSGFNLAIPINTAISQFSLKNLKASTSEGSNKDKKDEPSQSSGIQRFTFEVVSVNARGQVVERQSKSAQYLRENLGGGVSLDMVSIPGGTFTMGSPVNELERVAHEGPQHEVAVPAFYLGKYSITQAQWEAIMGSNPSKFIGPDRPVETVSWNEMVEFCQKLSQKSGRDYRLPSEAEWEYACRAGTSTPFYVGETITSTLANYRGPSAYGAGPKGEYRQQTTNVGSFPPNAFGLYDMHGNVWEWCQDTYHETYTGAPADGSAWVDNGSSRIFRGGAWLISPKGCRSAYRGKTSPGTRANGIGFRVVCSAPNSIP